jgi:hypothetical protein
MKFNEDKLNESKKILLDAYESNDFIFSKVGESFRLPSNIQKGSREHALYLFFVAPATYYADSEILWSNFNRFYEERPEFFDPEYIINNFIQEGGNIVSSKTKGTLKDIIAENLRHGFSSEIARRWYQNSRKLYREYEGDPRNIFKNVFDAEEALRRLNVGKKKENCFRGFGQKTGNLLLLWFSKYGLLDEKFDTYTIEVPFDRHAINFTVGHEIVTVEGTPHKKDFVLFAKENFKRNFLKDKTDPRKFTEAQWILGSKVCSKNDCVTSIEEKDCPFYEPCKYRLDSSFYYELGRIKVERNIIRRFSVS